MPKIPSGPKPERIKFCVACNQEITWQARVCPHCGSSQDDAAQAPARASQAGPWVYDVVAFRGRIQGESAENAQTVSAQLKLLINEYAEKGWEFQRVDRIGIEVKPGCLGGLLGRSTEYVEFDQVVFRRPR